jgi:hypothetical protein
MHIRPEFITIGELFVRNNVFIVPKYQRPYAWGDEEIADFCRDIESSFRKRGDDSSRDHFFGGLLCAQRPRAGQARASNTIVDGQQRLATFVLLASRMVAKYEAIGARSDKMQAVATRRARDLRSQYIVFEDRTNMVPKELPRLRLSRHDDCFFQKLTSLEDATPKRYSHTLLTEASRSIDALLQRLTGNGSAKSRIGQLVRLENLLSQAVSVIHLATDDISDAYRLFQVINDRGRNLTECDLLRAHTLGRLDTAESQKQLGLAEALWDEIQDERPDHLQDYLRWYYASWTGKPAGKTTLYDEFVRERFPRALSASDVVQEIRAFKQVVAIAKQMREGEWPFASSPDMWKTARLRRLLQVLKHDHCMPLLIGAHALGEGRFVEVIRDLDKFFFRYKVICKAHATPMASVYLKHAKLIHDDPSRFTCQRLRQDLDNLLTEYAPSVIFTANLGGLKYEDGGGNKDVKYLLITLAENWPWVSGGCRGGRRRRWHLEDHSRVFDFKNTTIEHIYPQNAPSATVEPALEALKNTIGNLTVLDPGANQEIGNVPFASKRKKLRLSSNLMNREITRKRQWRVIEVETWQRTLLCAAVRVFGM